MHSSRFFLISQKGLRFADIYSPSFVVPNLAPFSELPRQ